MNLFNYNFVFLFILLAFQNACGQVTTKSETPKVVVVQNKSKETKAAIENEKTDAKKIETDYPSLKMQADEMRKAFVAKDFEKYVGFLHPKLIEISGGKEKYASDIRATYSNLSANSVEFVSYEIGSPIQAIEQDGQIFVVLPMETKMRDPQKITTEKGNLLAISENKGKNWIFIRASSKERLRFLFPELVDKLNFSDRTVE